MKTIIVGFKISKGVFTPENGKDPINYSNREVVFMTDSGADSENIGFKPFTEKFKLAELAKILCVQESDDLVNDALKQLLNKPVTLDFAPVANSLRVVNFTPEK